MCGVFFAFDQRSSGSQLESDFNLTASAALRYRGPDGFSTLTGANWLALHSLLSVTGSTKQPCHWRHGIFLFNGEIYNDWPNYSFNYGDVDLLTSMLDCDGLVSLRNLDGEFACIILDESKMHLHLFSDPFGTKPLYYSLEQGKVGAATFDYLLKDCGFSSYLRCPPNTHLEIDLQTSTVIGQHHLIKFNFQNSSIDSFEPFCEAFSLALRKRSANVQRTIYLPLSSGHDSGLIAAELENEGVDFVAYGFEYGEDIDVLNARYQRLREKGVTANLLNPSAQELDEIACILISELPPFIMQVDGCPSAYLSTDARKVPGYIAAAYMANYAKSNGQTICLSGQGADEIISDYYNQHTNSRRSFFRGKWELATSPWPNFYGGWNKVYLEASERIIGHFGIETRYPFLDPMVVQQFLNLTPDFKGMRYKGCIAHRLDHFDYPYHERKMGFAGYPPNIS